MRKCPGVYFKKLLPQGLLGTEQLVAFVCQGSTYPLSQPCGRGKVGVRAVMKRRPAQVLKRPQKLRVHGSVGEDGDNESKL